MTWSEPELPSWCKNKDGGSLPLSEIKFRMQGFIAVEKDDLHCFAVWNGRLWILLVTPEVKARIHYQTERAYAMTAKQIAQRFANMVHQGKELGPSIGAKDEAKA